MEATFDPAHGVLDLVKAQRQAATERLPSGHRITSMTQFAEGGWRMAPEATEAYGETAFRLEIGFEDSTEDQRGI
eukprot:15385148-Alexandrium_andersonii.AAC.1